MKYLLYSVVAAVVVASSIFTYTALGNSPEVQKQLGPHSGQKFVLVKHSGGLRAADTSNKFAPVTIALVLTVEQRMNGKEQEITASAAVHGDGPTGPLIGVDGLSVHVTQPADFGTKPTKTAEAHIIQPVPSAGGKYKTVVAEARLNSPQYADAVISLTIPGDK